MWVTRVKKGAFVWYGNRDTFFWFHLKVFLIFYTNESQFLDLETCHFIYLKKKKNKASLLRLEKIHNKSNSQVLAKQNLVVFHSKKGWIDFLVSKQAIYTSIPQQRNKLTLHFYCYKLVVDIFHVCSMAYVIRE